MQTSHRVLIGCIFALTTNVAIADETLLSEELPQASQGLTSEQSDDVVMYALGLVDTNYKFGGNTPDSGLDCSGFIRHVFKHIAHLSLPHNARAISQTGQKISLLELKPGDLVFFNTLRRKFSHVGIYLGENRFVHAASSRTGRIMISEMNEQYWEKRFNGARRLLPSPSSPQFSVE